eukprot:6444178-Pyramimonas_sp.AAC.1
MDPVISAGDLERVEKRLSIESSGWEPVSFVVQDPEVQNVDKSVSFLVPDSEEEDDDNLEMKQTETRQKVQADMAMLKLFAARRLARTPSGANVHGSRKTYLSNNEAIPVGITLVVRRVYNVRTVEQTFDAHIVLRFLYPASHLETEIPEGENDDGESFVTTTTISHLS